MKKILTIAVAAVAMALTASANTVLWGLNEGETVSFSDGTIYLVQGSLPSTTGWDEKESFSSADLGGTIIASGALDSGYYDGSILVTSVNGNTGRMPFFMAAISSDGKTIDLADSVQTIQIKNNQNNSFVNYDGSGFTTYTAYVPPTPPTPPIPEPTTVALLALGLAAIGLKRKVA